MATTGSAVNNGLPVLPSGLYAMMWMPFSLQRSTISCCGSAGWFSIWLTAGTMVACGRSSSR
jgi:hypothetical protein